MHLPVSFSSSQAKDFRPDYDSELTTEASVYNFYCQSKGESTMKRSSTYVVFGVGILISMMFLFIAPAETSMKPKPVDGLMDMFENLNELEEAFRANKWNEADKVVKIIMRDYKNMLSELKGSTDPNLINRFGTVLGEFRRTLALKDPEMLEEPFMNIQDLFLDIMDSFDYPHPPVLKILSRWLNESKEYLEADQYDYIADELGEIGHFKDRVLRSVSGGQDLVTTFFEQAEKARQNAEAGAKGKEDLEKTLRDMESLIQRLMK